MSSAVQLPSAPRGRFFVLDGVDGCGKSTQARLLVEALERHTRARAPLNSVTTTPQNLMSQSAVPLHLREPGSTELGEKLRALLLGRGRDIAPRVETLLFAAARAQMLAELVEPALALGRHVVCERFHPSTFAYQAVAGGLPEHEVLELLATWAGDPMPDLVILLELSPEAAAERRGRGTDRIEDKGLEFQRRVALGYARYPEASREYERGHWGDASDVGDPRHADGADDADDAGHAGKASKASKAGKAPGFARTVDRHALAYECVTIDGARDKDVVARDIFAEVVRALR